MDYEQIKRQAEDIEKAAVEMYRNDLRMRMLIDSSVGMARHIEGPIDPEEAERDAADLALRACSLLAARILHDDAELRNARAERDHYREVAMDSLSMVSPRSVFVQTNGVDEFPTFVEQVRRDQRPMKETALTLPLEVVESLINIAKILHVGNLKPHDREMLAIAEREVEQVMGMVGG